MRQIVMFDLPSNTPEEKKEYRKFRKFLVDEGFLMLQYSVYTKLSLNNTQAQTVIRRIEKNKPKGGCVVVLKVTEKQFAGMTYVTGNKDESVANTDARLIFLGKR